MTDTGVGIEAERSLSAPFIRGKDHGTRPSTVLLVEQKATPLSWNAASDPRAKVGTKSNIRSTPSRAANSGLP